LLAGLGVTYALGLLWLAFFAPVDQVVPLGFAPFILGDLISIAIVAIGVRFMPSRLIGKIGR